MRIADERSDAIQILKRIKEDTETLLADIAELEYLIYEVDERCLIKFFERGVNDKKGSKERTTTDKGYGSGHKDIRT